MAGPERGTHRQPWRTPDCFKKIGGQNFENYKYKVASVFALTHYKYILLMVDAEGGLTHWNVHYEICNMVDTGGGPNTLEIAR